jgi:hypothetical protein
MLICCFICPDIFLVICCRYKFTSCTHSQTVDLSKTLKIKITTTYGRTLKTFGILSLAACGSDLDNCNKTSIWVPFHFINQA